MDRTIKTKTTEPNSDALLDDSAGFKRFRAHGTERTQTTMELFKELATLTRATIVKPLAAQLKATAREPQPTPAPAEFSSQRQEYQPALKDHSVVDALLQFHRSRLPTRAVHRPAPQAATELPTQTANPGARDRAQAPSPRTPSRLAPQIASAREQGFRGASLPEVNARVKPNSGFHRASVPASPILRGQPERPGKK